MNKGTVIDATVPFIVGGMAYRAPPCFCGGMVNQAVGLALSSALHNAPLNNQPESF